MSWLRRRRSARPREARRTFSDSGLQAELDTFGFVVCPLLDAGQLAAVRAAHRRLGVAPDDPRASINWTFHSRSAEHKRAVKQEVLPLVAAAVDQVLDRHVAYLTTFITKWPGPNGGFAPHQDPTLVDEREFRGVTVWVPLQDTGVIDGRDNGMLHVVPGSHRFSTALRVQDVDQFQFAAHERAIIDRHGMAVPVSAGEAMVFDNRLIHYSRPNETDVPRVVLSLAVRPAEARCVLLRSAASGQIDVFAIPDDFYIEVLPAQQHRWTSPSPPVATLDAVPFTADATEFDAMCRSVPRPRRALPGRRSVDPSWIEPDAFCALCGSGDGLEAADRVGRNNAQLVCGRCETGLST